MKKNEIKKGNQLKNDKKKKNKFFPWVFGGMLLVFVVLLVVQMMNEKNTNVAGLQAGTPAPEFTLQSTQGEISLKDFKGKNVVLYFYEGNS
jgi:cytochrome oxidase Cu insertion factor (SCO1/SenC/PrrC family)